MIMEPGIIPGFRVQTKKVANMAVIIFNNRTIAAAAVIESQLQITV